MVSFQEHPHNSVILNDHEIATIHAEQNAINAISAYVVSIVKVLLHT